MNINHEFLSSVPESFSTALIVVFILACATFFLIKERLSLPFIRRLIDIGTILALLVLILADKFIQPLELSNHIKIWSMIIGTYFALLSIFRMISQRKI